MRLPPLLSRLTRGGKYALPLAVFAVALIAFIVVGQLSGRPPTLASMAPPAGEPGGILVLSGSDFGVARGDSYVEIAGVAPTSGSYIDWSDTRISLRIPSNADSGLVHVFTRKGRSNGLLFTNKRQLPAFLEAEGGKGMPAFAPDKPLDADRYRVGDIMRIRGSDFGATQAGASLIFTWIGTPSAQAGQRASASGLLPDQVAAEPADILSWSDTEIVARVPDGAGSGDLRVRTSRGTSSPRSITVYADAGKKALGAPKTYSVGWGVEITGVASAGPSALYLWIPRLVEGAEQRDASFFNRSRVPLVEDAGGAMLYQEQDLPPGSGVVFRHEAVVTVYPVATQAKPASLRPVDPPAPGIADPMLRPDRLVPADAPSVVERAATVAGGERNPYYVARLIYDWLAGSIAISRSPVAGALEALSSLKADPYSYSLLFCALARARGIRAVPVAGVLVGEDKTAVVHYWAEFWLDSVGWVPVDPAMAAGYAPPGFPLPPNPAGFYFGSMDASRIAFARGVADYPEAAPGGVAVRDKRTYSFQGIYEERVGALSSYTSFWTDVSIIGVY